MRRLRYVAALLALVLAACSGSGTPSPGTSAPAVTPTQAMAGVATGRPSTTPAPGSPRPAAGCPAVPEPTGTPCYTITIRDFAFSPAILRVPTTARIVFVNEDATPHSIAWADGTPTSPVLATGDTAERKVAGASPSTLNYMCGIHGARMSGQIVVDPTLPVP